MRKIIIVAGLAALLLGGAAVPAASADAGTLALVSIPARRIPVDNRFIPPRVGGDAEFNGHGPDVLARGTLTGVGTSRLSVLIFMDAIETTSDFTHVRGTSQPFLIYVAPPGQCVVSVSRGTFDELRYRDNDHGVDTFPGQVTNSFVREWSIVGDTSGDEAGTETGAALSTFTFTANVQAC
jgi:hypothetical protein